MKVSIQPAVLCVILSGVVGQADDGAKLAPGMKQVGPHIRVHVKEKWVEVDVKQALREGPLELIACMRNTKEHEAIVSVLGNPQHLHLALLMAGVEPGEPGRWEVENDKVKTFNPTGGPVNVSLAYELGGRKVEKQIRYFVKSTKGKLLPKSHFVFCGSMLTKTEDDKEPAYAATVSGNVVSLVSFGDEVLAWPSAASKSNEMLEWTVNTLALPPKQTPMVMRLRPVAKRPVPELFKPKKPK